MSDTVLRLAGILSFLCTFAIASSQESIQCEPVAGYTAYAGVDHPLNDLPQPNCVKAPVSSLAAKCNTLPWCVSFNTDGCLKYKQNTTQAGKPDGFCFYVKDVSRGCPAVPGFDVQQSRGYNDMTPDGQVSFGRGCFRNISITQLAQECQADPSCNAFDSWGCLKNYTFLNDNGLGPSYCFYTKTSSESTDIPYCIQGWDSAGVDVAQHTDVLDIATCQELCAQNPSCTFVVLDTKQQMCYLKKDLMYGPGGVTAQFPDHILCTEGQPTCPSIEGFRAYFGRASLGDVWLSALSACGQTDPISIQYNQQLAAECLATPGCAGFNPSGCLVLNPAIDTGFGINCFYERMDLGASPDCPTFSGYTVQRGVNHRFDDLEGTCFRNQTIEQTAQDCNQTPDCAAFNSLSCLISGDNVTVDYNGRSYDFCYYSKETLKNLPASTPEISTGLPGSTNLCEPVPGYTAYPGADHTGDNLPGLNCINASVQTLAQKCNHAPWCVSFNTDGCLKYKETTTESNKTDGSCFYTKDISMACPHVPGFLVQQGRGYNDMTADGDISIGKGCFRNVSIAQLAQECQADASCNAFDSWGCLKSYTFLNDNGLGPSYCFYTKEGGGTTDSTPYCIQGWNAAGTDVVKYSNVTDVATCQQLCNQNPDCTFIVFSQPGTPDTCFLKKDMLFGSDGITEPEQGVNFTICTKGAPTCPPFPGFRSYFGSKYVGTSFCVAPGSSLPDAAIQCLSTPECAGFDDTACITIKSTINTRLIPTCFWERAYFTPGTCETLPGYTALPPGLDHTGDDLPGTCGRNQSFTDTAKDCNASESCTAMDSYGCLKLGDNVTVNDNSFSDGFCYYLKNTVSPVPLSPAPTQQAPAAPRKSVSAGAIAGIAVGGAVFGLLAVLLVARLCGRHHEDPVHPQTQQYIMDGHAAYMQMMQNFADIPGLTKGEAFTRATAYEYTWVETANSSNFTNVTSKNESEVAIDGTAGPAIQLTRQQVKEQIQLLRDGLLGRGATALVFKGLWPSRFGESAVLAVKVLQDGYTADMYTLDSFCYEASVLASLNPPHPNVIRLYGYCLEPPTVCLILEMLPGSLKNRLYPKPPLQNTPRFQELQEPASKESAAAMSLLPYSTTSSRRIQGSMSSHAVSQSQLPRSDTNTTLQYSLNDNTESVEIIPGGGATEDVVPSAMGPSSNPKLSMLDVLQISIDIVTGLKYLHDMPLAEDAAMIDTGQMLSGLPESAVSSPRIARPFDQKGHKIVHRDLKPANILLDADGRAKITDFGLARRQQQETMETRNLAAGTLPYMAPELLIAKEVHSARFHATNRVDIYSMGMIMWELLAGRTPWAHMVEQVLVNMVLSGRRPELPVEQQDDQPVVPLSEMPASLHALPGFNNIIRACWNHREHQRPSAAALYDMLISLRDKYI